jgi:hypothetical protein
MRTRRTVRLVLGLLAALGLLVVLGTPVALAQGGASFTAQVDRNASTLGESIVYEVTLSIADGRVQSYRPPDFRGFRVLGEYPSQSTQIQMGGGASVMRTVYSWRYELSPAESGRLSIGPARVKIGNRELRTASITISVDSGALSPSGRAAAPDPGRPGRPSAAPARRRNPRFAHPFDDLFGRADDTPVVVPPASGATTEGSFIRAVPDKQKVVVGEQVVVQWFLYLTDRQDKYQLVTEPRTDGFWSEELAMPSSQGGLALTQEAYQGRMYLVAPLMRKALFPLQAGKLTITPLESEISQVDFFGRQARTQKLKAEPLTIEVEPLPSAGQPPGFDPSAVGQFTLEAKLDRPRVAVGEAVTVKLVITGAGNLRKLAPPPMPALDGWRTYDPKVDVKVENTDGISGVKTVEYLLLPQRPGVTAVPAFSLAYFDPALRRYAVARTAPLPLTAVGDPRAAQAAGAGAGGVPAGAMAGVENVLPAEIRPPRATATLTRDLGTTFYGSPAFLLVVLLPPVGLGLTVMVERLRARLGRDTERTQRRKTRALVQGHLRAAAAELDRGHRPGFFMEIDRVLGSVLTARLHRPVAGLSRAELADELTASGLPPALGQRVVNELEACDRARFAPGNAGPDEMRATLDRAAELILILERTSPAASRRRRPSS